MTTSRYFRPEPVVIQVAAAEVFGVAVLDAATEAGLPVGVLAVAVLAVAALGAVVVVVLPVVVVDVPCLEEVAEVFLTGVVVEEPGLAWVAEVFGVVEVGAGVWGDSVCASRIPAETKLQKRMMIERFIVHPFGMIEPAKVSSP
jgi:hypothetical protein